MSVFSWAKGEMKNNVLSCEKSVASIQSLASKAIFLYESQLIRRRYRRNNFYVESFKQAIGVAINSMQNASVMDMNIQCLPSHP